MFEIKEFPVRDFDDALANNIIVGPGSRQASVSNAGLMPSQREETVHHTKLQLLDDFRSPVNDLGLSQVDLRTFRRLHRAAVKESRSWQENRDESLRARRLHSTPQTNGLE